MATKTRRFFYGNYYHIYNCGVEKRIIYNCPYDFQRFLDVINFYMYERKIRYGIYNDYNREEKRQYNKLHPTGVESLRVKVLCYCLMPNHFHFLIRSIGSEGLVGFISDICNSHARYFNLKNDRIGKLFQGPFKSQVIQEEESLLQVSRYIHLNPVFSQMTNPEGSLLPENYLYSSYQQWLDDSLPTYIIDKEEIMKILGEERISYKMFVEAKINSESLVEFKNLFIEKPCYTRRV